MGNPGKGFRLAAAIAAASMVAVAPASALVRYMVQGMTCADVQGAVERDGSAILYRQAGQSGVPLYDLYVAREASCQPGQTTIRENIPTADTTKCPVAKCVDQNRFGGSNR